MSVVQLQEQHDRALNAADSIISAAERQKRPLEAHEHGIIDGHLKTAADLKEKIAAAKPAPTRSAAEASRDIAAMRAKYGIPRPARAETRPGRGETILPKKFSRDYYESFYGYLSGAGPMSAAMYEGSSSLGGYAIPILVNDQAVALAPQDSAVRRLAAVVPTKSDIRTPQVNARATVAAKTETSGFTTAVPTLGQFTLSAFMAGVEVQTSIEIAQDVDLLRAFVLDDAIAAFSEYEEINYISGTGNGQAQGLIGNVGAGVTDEPDGAGNLVSIQATLDVQGTLKETYHADASWLMQRSTSLLIRKAQTGSGLYSPIFRRENGKDYLHGYEVAYSSAMPAAARGNTPVLFGDFRRGYIIGDRGGSALLLKVLDQANAADGLMDILLFRRSDGRVRRSEAIQSLTIAAS